MVTVDELFEEADELGIMVDEARLPLPYFGCYDDRSRTITLASGLRSWQLRCALCHELVHAIHRDPGCMTMQGIAAERRAKREAALRLIDPIEYASAESLYDGDGYLMACELDVTVQVLMDYRRILEHTIIRFKKNRIEHEYMEEA